MNREEAINKLNWALDNNIIEDVQSAYDYIMAIRMAIEALEQEESINKIIQKAYEDGKRDGYVQAKVEHEPWEDAIKRFDIIYKLSQTYGMSYSFVKKEIEKALETSLPLVTPAEKFGYEKIVSNNSVEQEVEE